VKWEETRGFLREKGRSPHNSNVGKGAFLFGYLPGRGRGKLLVSIAEREDSLFYMGEEEKKKNQGAPGVLKREETF